MQALRTGNIDVGVVLLRVVLAYSLIWPAYLTAASFSPDSGPIFSALQIIGLILFSVGTLFLILGFLTRITTLALFLYLITLHLTIQTFYLFNLNQILMFLPLVLIGSGRYSIDFRLFSRVKRDQSLA